MSDVSILRHADPEIMKQAGWESSEWISVEDRLPDWEEKAVMQILIVRKAYDTAKEAMYNPNIKKFMSLGFSVLEDVTHWKPLPQPPKQ